MTSQCHAAFLSLALAFIMAASSLAGEPAEFMPVSIEQLQEPSVALGEKDVEIVLRKIKLDAEVAAPPMPRRAQYLVGVLRDMGANPVPKVSQGMDIRSPKGKTLNVYLEDSVAERAGKELNAGDQATFYGYYVYNSKKHGPGILVSGFEVPSRIDLWQGRISRWLAGQ